MQRTTQKVLAIIMSIFIIMPFFVFAQVEEELPPQGDSLVTEPLEQTPVEQDDIKEVKKVNERKIDEIATTSPKQKSIVKKISKNQKLCERLTNQEAKLAVQRIERDQKTEERRSMNDRKTYDGQIAADSARDTKNMQKDILRTEKEVAALNKIKKAQTKEIVVARNTSMQTAVKTHRATVESVVKDFRGGLNQLITSRRSKIDGAIKTRRAAVDAAFVNAKESCATGDKQPKEVVAALRAKRDEAIKTYKAEADEVIKEHEQLLKSLKDKRKKAIDDSTAVFKTEIERIKQDTQSKKTSLKQDIKKSMPQVYKIVLYSADGFLPASVTIKPGEKIVFRNQSDVSMWVASDPHPVHSSYQEFDALKGYSAGEQYSFTFMQKGTWTYHNHLNPSHVGTIMVNNE